MKLLLRRITGLITRIFFLGYGTCARCGRAWAICREHTVMVGPGSGCFAICEPCWQECTKDERFSYYYDLLASHRCTSTEFETMRNNILSS